MCSNGDENIKVKTEEVTTDFLGGKLTVKMVHALKTEGESAESTIKVDHILELDQPITPVNGPAELGPRHASGHPMIMPQRRLRSQSDCRDKGDVIQSEHQKLMFGAVAKRDILAMGPRQNALDVGVGQVASECPVSSIVLGTHPNASGISRLTSTTNSWASPGGTREMKHHNVVDFRKISEAESPPTDPRVSKRRRSNDSY